MKIVNKVDKKMKKGFTLIELLAVIVILAIIALIATPIVLNIINDTKESAILRSADFYVHALELSISTATLDNQNIKDGVYNIIDGDMCLNEGCSKKLKVEVNGEVPKTGTVTITEGGIEDITLNISDKTVTKNEKGQFVIGASKEEPVCKLVENGDVAPTGISVGDKYQCKVKDNMEKGWEDGYYFYVLSIEEDGTANLIMDRNINSDGTPVSKAILESDKDSNGGIYNLVEWVSKKDYNDDTNYGIYGNNNKGPITAMNFLYNATKDWINIPALNYTYNDKEYQGTTEENRSYTSFVSNNGVATITALAGSKTTIGTSDKPLRARMPIFSKTYDKDWYIISEKGEVSDLKSDEENKYLYYHMALDGCYDNEDDYNEVACEDAGYIEGVYEKGIENIDGIYGYWTLSSDALNSSYAWSVFYYGSVGSSRVVYGSYSGVRAVVNLKI